MKFKLFSLAPLSAVVATPMILISSCGSSKPAEQIEMINITKDYDDPSIKPLKLTDKVWANQTDATKLYRDAVANDPDLFIKDMVYGAGQKYDEIISLLPVNSSLTSYQVGFTTPTLGTTHVWEMGFEDNTYTTVSFEEKVYMEFRTLDSKYSSTVQKVTANIYFDNVIFLPSESFMDGIIWDIGPIDETLSNEAFWMHQYNTNPWSISYGIVNESIKTVKDPYSGGEVKINNCEYYSGNVDSASKMYNLYDYHLSVDGLIARGRATTQQALENILIKLILCLENHSKLLSEVLNAPDVCLWSQLRGSVGYAQTNNILLEGVGFLAPKSTDFVLTSINLDENDETSIVATGVGDSSKYLTIDTHAELELGHLYSQYNTFAIPCKLSENDYAVGATPSFNIYRKSLNIKINYTYKGTPSFYSTFLSLHYNTIVLTIGGNKN